MSDLLFFPVNTLSLPDTPDGYIRLVLDVATGKLTTIDADRVATPLGEGAAASGGVINALGNTTGATPVDLSAGDLVTLSVVANTTLSFTNTPVLGAFKTLRMRVTNGGAFVLTLPAINWVGGVAPAWLASGTELAVLTIMNIGGSVVIDGAYAGQVV